MYPDNILLWPDGFWCFREELSPEFQRDDDYRVIVHNSDEWLGILGRTAPFPPISHQAS